MTGRSHFLFHRRRFGSVRPARGLGDPPGLVEPLEPRVAVGLQDVAEPGQVFGRVDRLAVRCVAHPHRGRRRSARGPVVAHVGPQPSGLGRGWRPGTPPALAIEIDFSLPSERVIRALRQLILWRGKPGAIRCDNVPEYVSQAMLDWAQSAGIRIEFIQPGRLQQNACIERFNRTVRYEWLGQYHWSTLDDVQDHATQWMWTYNHDRPNMALGGITPKQRLAMAA